MPKTPITTGLEQKRKSRPVQEFKRRVLVFLKETNPPQWMRYKILCDLSKKIDMPFYGEPKHRVGCTMTVVDIAKKYRGSCKTPGTGVRVMGWD